MNYSCLPSKGFSLPTLPHCIDPLGMQSQDIPNSAITASSSANPNSFAPYLGRLHRLVSSGKYGSWAAGTNNVNQWFQVDFGTWTKVRAIATQGRQDSNEWVKSYSVTFGYDNVFYRTVNDENGFKKVGDATFCGKANTINLTLPSFKHDYVTATVLFKLSMISHALHSILAT